MEEEKKPYNYDLLLEYLSRKQSGSYEQFKKYVKNIDSESIKYQICSADKTDKSMDKKIKNQINLSVKMLSALGHVEFDFNERKFSVAPPVISLLPNSHTGVLCGYRTHELLNELDEICQAIGIKKTEQKKDNMPELIKIHFENNENIKKFEEYNISDIKIVQDFSKRLLANLPSIEDVFNEAIKQEPVDLDTKAKNVKVFNYKYFCGHLKELFSFNNAQGKKDYNVYERDIFSQKNYFILYQDKFYKIDKYYGVIYSIYKSDAKNALTYENKILKKRSKFLNLPELIERVLILASGIYNKKQYENIDEEMLKLLQSKIKLDITRS